MIALRGGCISILLIRKKIQRACLNNKVYAFNTYWKQNLSKVYAITEPVFFPLYCFVQ